MEKHLERVPLTINPTEDKTSYIRVKLQSSFKWFTNMMRKFSWALVLYQSLMGLLLLYLTIHRVSPYYEYWVLGLMFILLFAGGFYGWFVGKKITIDFSELGNVIFNMGGQWKKFLPVMITLISIRGILMIIDWRMDVDMTPVMRTLPTVVAGMLSTRGITLIIRYILFKKNHSYEENTLLDFSRDE